MVIGKQKKDGSKKMRYLILLLFFFFCSCGSGSADNVANIVSSDESQVSVNFGDSGEVDQEISNVTQNCLACCDGDEIDSECIGSLDVSCAPEDFEGSACEEEELTI